MSLTVIAVSDEGDTVVVHGLPTNAEPGTERVAVVFRAKTRDADPALAERASRLRPGTAVVVEYVIIDAGWHLGRGLEIR